MFFFLVFSFLLNFSWAVTPEGLCTKSNIDLNIKKLEGRLETEQLDGILVLSKIKRACGEAVLPKNYSTLIENRLPNIMRLLEIVLYRQTLYGELDIGLFEKYLTLTKEFQYPETPFRRSLKNSIITNKESQPEAEQSCSDIDLMKISKPLSIIQLQSDSNLCFAFSSSDLISYKVNKKVSPLFIALHGIAFPYNIYDYRSSLMEKTGSNSHTAIKSALSMGFCEEQGSSLTENFYSSREKMSLVELSTELNAVFSTSNSISQRQQVAFHKLKLLFPNLNHDDVWKVINNSGSNFFSAPDIFSLMLEASCHKSMLPPTEAFSSVGRSFGFSTPETKINAIDQQLANLNPVIMVIFSDAIKQNPLDHYDFSNVYNDSGARRASTLSLHAVTLVGRKYNKDKKVCEYIIKHHHPTDSYWETVSGQQLPAGLTILRRSDLEMSIDAIEYLEAK